MVHRELETDDRAVAPADERRAFDLERIKHGHDVVRHLREVQGFRPQRAAPVAAAVDHHHAVPRSERRHLQRPVLAVAARAV